MKGETVGQPKVPFCFMKGFCILVKGLLLRNIILHLVTFSHKVKSLFKVKEIQENESVL